ncbi:hypothetical protein PROFUN_00452 [Planoprotostelium fungivorum]|uniref:Uncharacterized protein n=1 Tax=Planoprotostelium fungivorum TaxID=1890364 RepID=A0A2P6N0W8_9EUKA|nr:hypothetical protein PROFUN_00452 [Planoprotostelium fungivorum]
MSDLHTRNNRRLPEEFLKADKQYYHIAGRAGCSQFAHAVRACEVLSKSLPSFHFQSYAVHPTEWAEFVEKKNQEYNYVHDREKSPLIWTYTGEYIYDTPSFLSRCRRLYNYIDDQSYASVSSIAAEDLEQCLTQHREIAESTKQREEKEKRNIDSLKSKKLFLLSLILDWQREIVYKPLLSAVRLIKPRLSIPAWKEHLAEFQTYEPLPKKRKAKMKRMWMKKLEDLHDILKGNSEENPVDSTARMKDATKQLVAMDTSMSQSGSIVLELLADQSAQDESDSLIVNKATEICEIMQLLDNTFSEEDPDTYDLEPEAAHHSIERLITLVTDLHSSLSLIMSNLKTTSQDLTSQLLSLQVQDQTHYDEIREQLNNIPLLQKREAYSDHTERESYHQQLKHKVTDLIDRLNIEHKSHQV